MCGYLLIYVTTRVTLSSSGTSPSVHSSEHKPPWEDRGPGHVSGSPSCWARLCWGGGSSSCCGDDDGGCDGGRLSGGCGGCGSGGVSGCGGCGG